MSIWTAIFGDPQAQQAANTAAFKAAYARLQQAKARGDQSGVAAALAEMRRINAKGAAIAQQHLDNVAQVQATANILKAEGQAVSGAFSSATSTLKWVAAGVIALAVWRTLVMGKKAGRSLGSRARSAANAVKARVRR